MSHEKKITFLAVGALIFAVIILLLARFDSARSQSNEDESKLKGVGISTEVSDQESDRSRALEEILTKEEDLPDADGVADIADVDLPLFFEDRSLRDSLRREIELDLEQLNAARKSYRIYESEKPENSDRVIHFSGGDIDVPDIVYNELNRVRTVENDDQLVVTKTLSEVYAKAIEFREQHRKEYDALVVTRNRINQTHPSQVTARNALSILPVIFYGEVDEGIRTNPEKAVSYLAENVVTGPSVLEFGREDYEGESVLAATLYYSNSAKEWYMKLGFILNDGKWCAVLGPPGS